MSYDFVTMPSPERWFRSVQPVLLATLIWYQDKGKIGIKSIMKTQEQTLEDVFTKFVIIPLFSIFMLLPVYLFILVRSMPMFPEMTSEFRKKMQSILP